MTTGSLRATTISGASPSGMALRRSTSTRSGISTASCPTAPGSERFARRANTGDLRDLVRRIPTPGRADLRDRHSPALDGGRRAGALALRDQRPTPTLTDCRDFRIHARPAAADGRLPAPGATSRAPAGLAVRTYFAVKRVRIRGCRGYRSAPAARAWHRGSSAAPIEQGRSQLSARVESAGIGLRQSTRRLRSVFVGSGPDRRSRPHDCSGGSHARRGPAGLIAYSSVARACFWSRRSRLNRVWVAGRLGSWSGSSPNRVSRVERTSAQRSAPTCAA